MSVPVSARPDEGDALTPSRRFLSPSGSQASAAEAHTHVCRRPSSASNLFDTGGDAGIDGGKIVVTEGWSSLRRAFLRKPAPSAASTSTPADIHWGISPPLGQLTDDRAAAAAHHHHLHQPPDGEAPIERLKQGPLQVTLHAELREVGLSAPSSAGHPGQQEPDLLRARSRTLRLVGRASGDNAVKDAALLNWRAFPQESASHGSARSLGGGGPVTSPIAIYPTGTPTISAWTGLQHCIAHLDIDSPGCRWADHFEQVCWMSELDAFCRQAIRDVTGAAAKGVRPFRAGDYSFNNLGISGFFMLLSEMSEEQRAKMGYYAVGGCGGNIAWHTENDQLEIADKDNLMRDLRVYVLSLLRVLNRPVHPFDFRRLAVEFDETLEQYGAAAANVVDFSDANQALSELQAELDAFYATLPGLQDRAVNEPAVRAANDVILALARTLVPIHFTRHGRFRNEPALPIPPLPDLEPALALPDAQDHERRVIATHVRRGLNRVAWAFGEAAEIVRRARTALPA